MVDMRSTCNYASNMSVMIQVRNVPETLHRRLKACAALAGQSLSDYLLEELRGLAEMPTDDEIRGRLASRRSFSSPEEIVQTVREGRDSR